MDGCAYKIRHLLAHSRSPPRIIITIIIITIIIIIVASSSFSSSSSSSSSSSFSSLDNDLIDMPAGKEKTGDVKIPFGIAKESEGRYGRCCAVHSFCYCCILSLSCRSVCLSVIVFTHSSLSFLPTSPSYLPFPSLPTSPSYLPYYCYFSIRYRIDLSLCLSISDSSLTHRCLSYHHPITILSPFFLPPLPTSHSWTDTVGSEVQRGLGDHLGGCLYCYSIIIIAAPVLRRIG